VTLFRASNPEPWLELRPDYGWGAVVSGGLSIRPISGDHQDFIIEHVDSLARQLNAALART
jgi:hypothetical protein